MIDLADDSQEDSPPTKKATGGSEGKGQPSIQTKSLSTKEFLNLFDTKQSKPDPPKKRRRTAMEKKKPDKVEKKQTTTKAAAELDASCRLVHWNEVEGEAIELGGPR